MLLPRALCSLSYFRSFFPHPPNTVSLCAETNKSSLLAQVSNTLLDNVCLFSFLSTSSNIFIPVKQQPCGLPLRQSCSSCVESAGIYWMPADCQARRWCWFCTLARPVPRCLARISRPQQSCLSHAGLQVNFLILRNPNQHASFWLHVALYQSGTDLN